MRWTLEVGLGLEQSRRWRREEEEVGGGGEGLRESSSSCLSSSLTSILVGFLLSISFGVGWKKKGLSLFMLYSKSGP